jgi:hypothetical protein
MNESADPTSADKLAARQQASELWRFMQLVEATRHLADRFEASRSLGSPIAHEVHRTHAAQLREIAERLYALSRDAEVISLAEHRQAGESRSRRGFGEAEPARRAREVS